MYQLVDGRDGKPFYVGKGTGNRVDAHEKEAKRFKRSSSKLDKIREILDSGNSVNKQILAMFWCEEAAYEFEKHIIDSVPNLTNISSNKGAVRVKWMYFHDELFAMLKYLRSNKEKFLYHRERVMSFPRYQLSDMLLSLQESAERAKWLGA